MSEVIQTPIDITELPAMMHGGRLLLALLIGIGLAALGRVVYAQNSGYIFYIPTSTAPVGHSVPVTLPSGYCPTDKPPIIGDWVTVVPNSTVAIS